ncbi:Glycosyltransferase [Sulfidibacter corallicola]|uniref:Glycosyltransferase n=1 Tax=Sulfidibacter corallicola TaxID=2818388 RepID=A0A8A4TR77_SULCO|nr:glycosyltransferase [Sulfidibacter corallicola]QTD52023.1 glycosyltransferase [Sulfidibacter corallicola]
MNYLVMIPTYNAAATLESLGIGVLHVNDATEILFIDDGSTDDTRKIILKLEEVFPGRVHHLFHEKRLGLGTSYLAGFRWGLAHGYPWLFQMNADFSHHPADLQQLITATRAATGVVGSRFVAGSGDSGSAKWRLMFSRLWSRWIKQRLNTPVLDMSGGFNGWHKEVLARINFGQIQSRGSAFQIELKYLAAKAGARYWEVPIGVGPSSGNRNRFSFKDLYETLRFTILSKPVNRALASEFTTQRQH